MISHLNFGIECEIEGGTRDVLDHLGLDDLHSYHCSCNSCEPSRSGPDWTGQEDCTAGGEFISRILTYGTPDADNAIEALGRALKHGRATTSDGQGVHVHVDCSDMTPTSVVYFWRLWFRYQDDLAMLAKGRFHEVRDYNTRVHFRDVVGEHSPSDPDFWRGNPERVYRRLGSPYRRDCWVHPNTYHDTYEFRLWNTTRTPWRLHLAAGVSVALMAAAMDGVKVNKRDKRTLYEVLAPYMTDKATAAFLRAVIKEERVAA
ncbi:MAG: hypothetical protein WC822_07125 [Candidatus Paceibacterota bacterium]|jgi:hypothetical protein